MVALKDDINAWKWNSVGKIFLGEGDTNKKNELYLVLLYLAQGALAVWNCV